MYVYPIISLMAKSLAVVEAGKVEGHECSTTSVSSSQDNENNEIKKDDVATMNYNFAMKEVISNALTSGELKQGLIFYHLYKPGTSV